MKSASFTSTAILALLAALSASGGPFPAEFDLATLRPANGGDGSSGALLLDASATLTFATSGAGDINGDGLADFICAAPRILLPGSAGFIGGSFVGLGTDQGFPAVLDLSELGSTPPTTSIGGFRTTGYFGPFIGESVSGGGDVNGDGFDDIMIGGDFFPDAPGELPGGTLVVFGKAEPFSPDVSLQSLLPSQGGDGSAGFLISDNRPHDSVGGQVSIAGDINGDGYDDMLIGIARPFADGQLRAAAYVIFGSGSDFPALISLAALDPANGGDGSVGFQILGNDLTYVLATRTSYAGDVNADGIEDILIALPANAGGTVQSGEVFVIFGRSEGFGAQFELSSLLPQNGGDGSTGIVLQGTGGQERVGTVLTGGGDVNGDGIADIVIGTERSTGGAYVVFGRNTPFEALMALRSLSASFGGDGSLGFFANDAPGTFLRLGTNAMGDINGDGIDDVLFGASRANNNSVESAGRIFVVYGSADGFPPDVDLNLLRADSGANGESGFIILGTDVQEIVGADFSVVGDTNGNGADDILIRGRPNEPDATGYLLFGRQDLVTNDADADTIADNVDNCTQIANTAQRDSDNDGFGNFCDADFNNDCIVNVIDLGFFRTVFFQTNADADLNGDGVVNFFDLAFLRLQFFQAPGPSALASCNPD